MKLFISITLLLFCCCGMKGQQTDKVVVGVCVKKSGTESGINATRLPSGQPSGICDVGIIILDNGQQLPIAVFITNPSSQSKISDVAKQLHEL